jgi:hypothetical protein
VSALLAKILPWVTGISAVAALVFALLWRVEVARRDLADVQRDAARADLARCVTDLGGEKAVRAEESRRHETERTDCQKAVQNRDAKILEWTAGAPRGAAGDMLEWVLSNTSACDLPTDDLLSPAGAPR